LPGYESTTPTSRYGHVNKKTRSHEIQEENVQDALSGENTRRISASRSSSHGIQEENVLDAFTSEKTKRMTA
jgi:hypothetical protein